MFLRLLDVVRGVDEKKVEELRSHRQYEQLEMLILNALMGRQELTDATALSRGRTTSRHDAAVTSEPCRAAAGSGPCLASAARLTSRPVRSGRPHRHDLAAGVARRRDPGRSPSRPRR